jgi:uncharacterized membrane protein
MPMRDSVLLSKILIIAGISALSLTVKADAESLPKMVPYCSVAMASRAGSNRTTWGQGTVTQTCDAAKTWLGESNVDWMASGEFREDDNIDVQVRCARDGRLQVELFSGRGAEALQRAAYSDLAQSSHCLVAVIGDAVTYPKTVVANSPKDAFLLSRQQVVQLFKLDAAMRDPKNAQTTFDLPNLKVEDGNLVLHLPDAPRFQPAANSRAMRTDTSKVFDKTPVHSVAVGAGGVSGGSPGSSSVKVNELVGINDGFAKTFVDYQNSAGASGADNDVPEMIAQGAAWSPELGDPDKVSLSVGWNVQVQRDGNGSAVGELQGTVMNNATSVAKVQAVASRVNSSNPNNGKGVSLSGQVMFLGKTYDVLEPKVVELGLSKSINEQVYADMRIELFDVPFVIVVVPVEFIVGVGAKIGLHQDYVGIKVAEDDIDAIVVHAGIQPYGAFDGEASLDLATNRLKGWMGTPKLSVSGTMTFVDTTLHAGIDADTRAKGACADLTLMKPKVLPVNLALNASVDLGAGIDTAKSVLAGACKAIPRSKSLSLTGSVANFAGCGPLSGLCDKVSEVGRVVTGTLDAIADGVSAIENLSVDQVGDLLDQGLDRINAALAKGCNDAQGVLDQAGKFSALKYEQVFYRNDGIDYGDSHSWFKVDACHDRPAPSTLEVCNQHPAKSIDVAVARQLGGKWAVAGWSVVEPGSCSKIADLGAYKGKAYVYGRLSDRSGIQWPGKDKQICVDSSNLFNFPDGDAVSCFGSLQMVSTTGIDIKPGVNRFTMQMDLPTIKFCNQTDYETIYGAVAYSRYSSQVAAGWFPIKKGQCRNVLRLADGDIYAYATTDTQGQGEQWGTGSGVAANYCVSSATFKDLPADQGCNGNQRSFTKLAGDTWTIGSGGQP